jgi:hypothetical protein
VSTELPFLVRPRILSILGEQLLRSPGLAVFELVKNSYDADATNCIVRLEHPTDNAEAKIVVLDNGCGMDLQTIRQAWMVIATDFRDEQKKRKERTPRGRMALGEKGLGRLAVHKLGRKLRLVTRKEGCKEIVVEFDWERLEAAPDLAHATVQLTERFPKTFPGSKTGTRLTITGLKQDDWTRGEVRELYRSVTSLCSPFKGPKDFSVSLELVHNEEWLEGLLEASDVKKLALWHVQGHFGGDSASYTYQFTPPAGVDGLRQRPEAKTDVPLKLNRKRASGRVDLSSQGIGRVDFEFWLFYLDTAVLRSLTDDIKGLKEYLDQNGGVRIYRDGVRVYDFGEPDNDWLELDARRVNTPASKISRNQILGVLRLSAEKSWGLVEKANREGFIAGQAYSLFKEAVRSVLIDIEADMQVDRKRVRSVLGKGSGTNIATRVDELREAIKDSADLEKIEPHIKKLEQEVERYTQVLMKAAVPGMAFGGMIHNVEKKLEELRAAVRVGAGMSVVRNMVEALHRAMSPVTILLKNSGMKHTKASWLIRQAMASAEYRFHAHRIGCTNGLDEGDADFPVHGPAQVLVGAITNLISNAIHWLEIGNPPVRKFYIGTTTELLGGPAIVVADNGPGFGSDAPEDMIEPFFSRRGGMGLGLYLVHEVMTKMFPDGQRGDLIFPAKGDVALPKEFTGAVVALRFPPIS